jgi:hypothetical protein
MSRDLQAVFGTVGQTAHIAELYAIWLHLDFICTIVATSRLILSHRLSWCFLVTSSSFAPFPTSLRFPTQLNWAVSFTQIHSVRVRESLFRNPILTVLRSTTEGNNPVTPRIPQCQHGWAGRHQAPDALGTTVNVATAS